MDLNDQSPIKGKTWGRCKKGEMLNVIEYQDKVIRQLQSTMYWRDLLYNGCREAV